MKKIMFNDKYGLTSAVLERHKTITRRIVPQQYVPMLENGLQGAALIEAQRHGDAFREGEEVAVAQSYKSIHEEMINGDYGNSRYDAFRCSMVAGTKGFNNKMFVRADLMPYKIQITDIKLERLQDISNEDCLREVIWKDNEGGRVIGFPFGVPFYYTFDGAVRDGKQLHWTTPKEAFSALINKISGKGTWERNPWVFTYEFKLVK